MFLDLKKKAWVLNDLEVPVIENVTMKDMKWFRDKSKWVAEREEKQDLTQSEAMAEDDEWWEKTCKIGLGITVDEVLETGISEPEFRELMAEVYTFLAMCGTIKRAKLSAIYDPKILEREKELTEHIQSSKN